MTVLQALAGYYDRMAARGEVPRDGYSSEQVDYKLVIDRDGNVIDAVDIREHEGKRTRRKVLAVPKPQRTSNVEPNFLWDKTAYIFGVTQGDDKRTAKEHAAFREQHLIKLKDVSDPSLVAFRQFVTRWEPARFGLEPFKEEMKDKSFVVTLDGEQQYVHDTYEAGALVSGVEQRALPDKVCLISGELGPIAELHPIVKNVRGAQSSGAYLVSFNNNAFVSWGSKNGANAPVSVKATAQYATALNELLRSSLHTLQIGDATVVFWASTANVCEKKARAAEQILAQIFGGLPPAPTSAPAERNLENDAGETRKVREALQQVANGRPVTLDGVEVEPGTEIHILGLSPNAARLSVRFWLTERLEDLARNLRLHELHCKIEPLPWKTPPSIDRLVTRTAVPDAVRGKGGDGVWKFIQKQLPLLAGDLTRAVLGGTAYPRTLLLNALMRLRAGDDPASGWHAVALRAVLARDQYSKRRDHAIPEEKETPVSLKREHPNVGYQLGRLFAAYELAQRAALGSKLNRTIRDSYFSAAMSTPVTVFPSIIANGQNHLGKVRRDKPGWGVLIERELEQISGKLEPQIPSTIPKTLKMEDQAEFAIGYYHQRSTKLGKPQEEQLGFDNEIATPDEDVQ